MENETKRKIKAERNPSVEKKTRKSIGATAKLSAFSFREKISDLKEKIRQSKIEAAVLAIRKVRRAKEKKFASIFSSFSVDGKTRRFVETNSEQRGFNEGRHSTRQRNGRCVVRFWNRRSFFVF